MGCCGDREKGPVSEQQKWDYITLDDFKSKSCFAPFSYMWLWILVLTSIGVISADTFTAIQLLAFDRWSSQVDPAIPFTISKWIFAGCIILSFVLYAYEIQRAVRVMRRGGVADSYLDPMAVEWQSVRMGKGRGWRRFLVFAELTKSKKGVDYVALFVYFQFKTAIRIVAAEGPRQVINAITLYSVFRLNLLPNGKNGPKDGHSGIQQFWQNLQVLADKDTKQAVILSSMLFTFIIWFISALLLLSAIILYVLFLWHYIPSTDGSLSRYCRRKIDGRLEGIVSKKTRKALEKAEAKRRKEERQAIKRGETFAKPTLPDLDDDKASISTLSRTDTSFSKPPMARTATFETTASGVSRQPTLPDLDTSSTMSGRPGLPNRRPAPPRSATGSSYASNAPLLSNSGGMGYTDESVPSLPTPTSISDRDYFNASPVDYRPGAPGRSLTGSTLRSYGSPDAGSPGPYSPHDPNGNPISRPPTAQSRGAPTPGPGGMRRVDTSDTMNSNFSRRTPGPAPSPISPYNDAPSMRRYSPPNQPMDGPSYEMSPVRTSPPGGTPFGGLDAFQRPPTRQGTATPGAGPGFNRPPQQFPVPGRAPTVTPTSNPAGNGGAGYVAFNPMMHQSTAPPSSGTPAPDASMRNFSSPVNAPQRSNTPQGFSPQGPQRSFTSPMMPRPMEGPTGRSATAGPAMGGPGRNMGNAF